MKIVDLDKNHENPYLVCIEEWSEEMLESRHIKEQWYHQMKEKGLRVKLALTDDGTVGGMIEYMPIENSYAEGNDLYIINCIWVHGYEGKPPGNLQGRGMGIALLQAAEEDVKTMGKKGLAAWGLSEEMWMSASWFQKHGYEKADQEGWLVLVWKAFSQDAKPPRWIKGSFTQEPARGKVKVTSFYSGQCPSENITYSRARKIAEDFGDKVIFEEIAMSKPENRKKYGLKGGLYINGENIFQGPPPSDEQIKQKIEEKLQAMGEAQHVS
jgi:hypothetical protein